MLSLFWKGPLTLFMDPSAGPCEMYSHKSLKITLLVPPVAEAYPVVKAQGWTLKRQRLLRVQLCLPQEEENLRDFQPRSEGVWFLCCHQHLQNVASSWLLVQDENPGAAFTPLKFLAGVCWIPTTKYFVIRLPWAIAVILHL